MTRLLMGTLLAAAAIQAGGSTPGPQRLSLAFAPRFAGSPLSFDAMKYRVQNELLSVTRLDFLVSNFALRRPDGVWIEQTNQVGYVSLRDGPTSLDLNDVPTGEFNRVRFNIGVPAQVNHADPSRHRAGHPLNPAVNGLHWSWQGGYVFLALEGNWQAGSAPRQVQIKGYSFHVATDPLLMTVELDCHLAINADYTSAMVLAFDVDRIFSGRHEIHLADDVMSTHSRERDPLATMLVENIARAFFVDAVHRTNHSSVNAFSDPIEMAPGATPYPLELSRFFPLPALPQDNPLTHEGVELGRRLFHETRLSGNNRQSCASCHQSQAAFTDPGRRFSLGAENRPGTRNAMPLFNLAWKSSFFWDGRAPSLRAQVLMPIENPLEMHESLANVAAKLGNTSEIPYPELFARTFGSPGITATRIARALEQFLLTQVSANSKCDQVMLGEAKFTEQEQRGFVLFHTEYDPRRRQFGADCFHCHGGPLFQNQGFANNGLDSDPRDLGRFSVTGKPGDKGKFAVPSLRNVARTAPYMHDGRFATLDDVVAHYCSGVKRSKTLDPNLAKHPDGGVPLSEADRAALVTFLETLTDQRFTATP